MLLGKTDNRGEREGSGRCVRCLLFRLSLSARLEEAVREVFLTNQWAEVARRPPSPSVGKQQDEKHAAILYSRLLSIVGFYGICYNRFKIYRRTILHA